MIALAGKCLRRSGDAHLGKAAIYIVSAWATADRLMLGQPKVVEKSNEITAIPTLLAALDVRGCIVSIDAFSTQKTIAAQILAQEGHYLLAMTSKPVVRWNDAGQRTDANLHRVWDCCRYSDRYCEITGD